MEHTSEYAILTAVPEPRRGERVNVGLVVFRKDRLDVRFKHASYKLRALTGDAWEARLDSTEQRLISLFGEGADANDILARFEILEPLIRPTGTGWLKYWAESDYEQRVQEIMTTLVGIPPRERPEGHSRINTEIAIVFRKAKILAKPAETIETGKLIKGFPIAPNEGLTADFALKNGKLHIASTLDLRKQSANLGEAALKSIVLDKSEKIYGAQVRTLGVYAIEPAMREHFKQHVELLGDYAQDTFNWLEPEGRWKFTKSIYDAVGQSFDPLDH
jgi:hypothetical protein